MSTLQLSGQLLQNLSVDILDHQRGGSERFRHLLNQRCWQRVPIEVRD